jgi:hypothetical protein
MRIARTPARRTTLLIVFFERQAERMKDCIQASRRPAVHGRKNAQQRSLMSLHGRFEQVVAIVALDLAQARHQHGVVVDQRHHRSTRSRGLFQTLFGEVITLLVAMEFKHRSSGSSYGAPVSSDQYGRVRVAHRLDSQVRHR